MRTPRTILIVEADRRVLAGLTDALCAAGYECVGAPTYEDGRELLSSRSFDLAVVSAQVGPHNGLHLIRQGRLLYPGMEAVALVSLADGEARDEARRYGTPTLDLPVEPRRLLALAARLLSQLAQRRRWVRKHVRARTRVMVNERPAALVDVCYGGVRFEMSGGADTLPQVLRLKMPALEEPLLVSPVWSDRTAGTGRLRCGATLLTSDGPTSRAWREMVDTLPSLRRVQDIQT